MNRNTTLLRTLIAATLAVVGFVAAQNLPAGFNAESLRTHVLIDGTDFGAIDQVTGLDQFTQAQLAPDTQLPRARITLRRDFVTDPSLYLWAQQTTSARSGLKDVHLVTLSNDGREVSRRVLKLCQPLSWSVEAANPAVGGFHETVDLSVQELSVR